MSTQDTIAFEPRADAGAVAKAVGSDCELGNFVQSPGASGTADEASRLLLSEIRGFSRTPVVSVDSGSAWWESSDWYDRYPAQSWRQDRATSAYQPGAYREHVQDTGRKYLANGGSAYIDMSHGEMASPEVMRAADFVAASRAMLLIARDAMGRVNARLGPSRRLVVLANNTDGHGNSFGSHLNFLVTRSCWEAIFQRKLHYLLFLASFQAASIALTGSGKVGAENGRADVPYQISARADYMEQLVGEHTTYSRPVVNSRNESLSDARRYARVHCIFYDQGLCETASFLKVGMMQLVLAMIEQGEVPALMLEDPVSATHTWSHDPSLRTTVPVLGGVPHSALDVLEEVLAAATRFVEAGRAHGVVPEAQRILAEWADCLGKLRSRDWDSLASRLDWVAKWRLLDRAAARRGWDPARMQVLDHLYHSLDHDNGLFFVLERAGHIRQLVPPAAIERLVHEAPSDTRAWLRGYLIRNAAGMLDDVDWHRLSIRLPGQRSSRYALPATAALEMADPLKHTQSHCEAVLGAAPSLIDGLRELGLDSPEASRVASAELDPPHT